MKFNFNMGLIILLPMQSKVEALVWMVAMYKNQFVTKWFKNSADILDSEMHLNFK